MRTATPPAFRWRCLTCFDSQQGLSMLALDTGGLFIHDNNFIDSALHDAVADTEGYYLIGYHPDSATFDSKTTSPQFHKVQIVLKAPGLHVRSRRGFFGETESAAGDVPVTRVIRPGSSNPAIRDRRAARHAHNPTKTRRAGPRAFRRPAA